MTSRKMFLLADVLTLSRIGFAIVLVVMTMKGVPAIVALIVSVVAWLTDALDGSLAREAEYRRASSQLELTNMHNKDTWKVLDQVADICLIMGMFWYTWMELLHADTIVLLVVSVAIGLAIIVQIIREWNVYKFRQNELFDIGYGVNRLVIVRRVLLFLAPIVIMMAIMLAMSGMPFLMKIVCVVAGGLTLFALAELKHDRLETDKPNMRVAPRGYRISRP